MNCPSCGKEINIKKYEVIDCSCGAKIMAIEINKKITLEKVN